MLEVQILFIAIPKAINKFKSNTTKMVATSMEKNVTCRAHMNIYFGLFVTLNKLIVKVELSEKRV